MSRLAAATLTVLILLWPRPGAAQETALTIDQALALARERAPRLVSARARIDEARGRLVGASVPLRTNPNVEAGAGYRSGADGLRSNEGRFTVTQGFEIGGQRGARIAGAQAGLSRATSDSEDTTRRILRDVALAFLRALYAHERARFATATEAVAADVLLVSERRHQTGDIPRFDVNLARASHRPDLLSLEAELLEARADRDLGSAIRWPELGIVSFTFPIFERGQGLRAEATAHERRVSGELRAGRTIVAVEVRAALADLLAVRREIIGTRLEYLGYLLEAANAGIELESSAGVLQ